jgi:hypothetical protein
MVSTATLSLTLLAVTSIYKLINLYRHARSARQTGLPYVLTPTLETEVWSYILTPIFRKVYHVYLLQGKGWPRWCRFMIKDWAFEDKHRAHDEFGEVFLVVSPEGIICYSADATTNYDVMMRKNEFVKPHDKYSKTPLSKISWFRSLIKISIELLEPYGPNVNTAEGKTYQFHVRITAPPFNDLSGVNDLVWQETISQTKSLMKSWSEQLSQTLQLDVAGVTLAVISLAGFGKRLEWTSNSTDPKQDPPPPPGYKLSFLRAMTGTTTNLVAILLLPAWLLNLTPLREAALAYSQLEKYMRDMIQSEKRNLAEKNDHQSEIARGNLLTSLLRVSASEGNDESTELKKKAFTEDEVIGNLFIFLIAGYETTSNVVLYGLIVLAIQPDIQDNIIAEVDGAYAEAANEGRDELSYAGDFEKFEYTYGFMVRLTLTTSSCPSSSRSHPRIMKYNLTFDSTKCFANFQGSRKSRK